MTELCFGQSSQADSLKAVLESLDEDTSKVNTLIAICQEEYSQAPADALLYGNEALDLSEKLDYQKGMALANKFIGLCYYFQDFGDSLISFFFHPSLSQVFCNLVQCLHLFPLIFDGLSRI